MQVVLSFLSGLIDFRQGNNLLGIFGTTPMKILKSHCKNPQFFLKVTHWLFEAKKDTQLVHETLGDCIQHHILSGKIISPFDCYTLNYCVNASCCLWELELKSCNITNEGFKTLCAKSLLQVKILDLSQNKAADGGRFLGK